MGTKGTLVLEKGARSDACTKAPTHQPKSLSKKTKTVPCWTRKLVAAWRPLLRLPSRLGRSVAVTPRRSSTGRGASVIKAPENQPRCTPDVALGDAVIALTTKVAMANGNAGKGGYIQIRRGLVRHPRRFHFRWQLGRGRKEEPERVAEPFLCISLSGSGWIKLPSNLANIRYRHNTLQQREHIRGEMANWCLCQRRCWSGSETRSCPGTGRSDDSIAVRRRRQLVPRKTRPRSWLGLATWAFSSRPYLAVSRAKATRTFRRLSGRSDSYRRKLARRGPKR